MIITPDLLQQVSVFSITVIGIVEMLKKSANLKGFAAVLVSLLVSFGACLTVLSAGLAYYLTVSTLVFLSANGIFKAFHK